MSPDTPLCWPPKATPAATASGRRSASVCCRTRHPTPLRPGFPPPGRSGFHVASPRGLTNVVCSGGTRGTMATRGWTALARCRGGPVVLAPPLDRADPGPAEVDLRLLPGKRSRPAASRGLAEAGRLARLPAEDRQAIDWGLRCGDNRRARLGKKLRLAAGQTPGVDAAARLVPPQGDRGAGVPREAAGSGAAGVPASA